MMAQWISTHLHQLAMIGFACFAIGVMIIRLLAAKKPTNVQKILIPPLGMSTGFLMFLYPPMRIPWEWAGLVFIAGVLFFSLPLIKTSQFHIQEQQIYLKPSPAFTIILGTLVVLRLILHSYIEHQVSLFQTASLFFILAFGMLLPWRLAMYWQFRKVAKQLPL